MKYEILCGFAVFVFAVAMPSAQTKLNSSGKRSKPQEQHAMSAGDRIGHVFTIASVGGAASKERVFSEHWEVSGDHSKATVWTRHTCSQLTNPIVSAKKIGVSGYEQNLGRPPGSSTA
jgi:hypothetical protein